MSTVLTGDELIANVETLKPMAETEMAIACGYVSPKGKAKLSAFKDALLAAHGLELPKAPRATGPRKGKPLSYVVTAGKTNGNIVLAGGYATLIGIEPGQAVEIAQQGNSLVLTPGGVTATAIPVATAAEVVVTYDSTPQPVAVAA
jgi:hypothetical protein